MAESINNNNEQRSHTGSSGNSNSLLSRRKTNNGNDSTGSPKYNKLNGRGFIKDNQHQKLSRTNSNNNHQRDREQRYQASGGSTNPKQRNSDPNRYGKQNSNDHCDASDVFDDLVDDFGAIYDIDEQISSDRKASTGYSKKKKSMNHLLNFQYQDQRQAQSRSYNKNYFGNNRWSSTGNWTSRQSFSKEQFLQANCQFAVRKGSNDYSLHFADPDLAIDWDHVEQVHLHSIEQLKCPICLSEPQAGKITRCGHVFCWSCLLHYLALSDQSWRKCPVCCESVYKKDIRSVRGIISKSVKPGDWIHFRMMRRERGSTLFHSRVSSESEQSVVDTSKTTYAHLLFVDDETILNDIIEKDNFELLKQLQEDGEQPESCFIRQALEENNERQKITQHRIAQGKSTKQNVSATSDIDESIDLLPRRPIIVYEDAFNNIIKTVETNEQEAKIVEAVPLETVNTLPEQETSSNEEKSYVYFYQADDLYHTYLNGLNARILIHEFGSYQQCPDELHVRVEAIETHFMTEEIRSQFRFLNHLPLTCEFQLVEIRLHPPLISPSTMEHFSDEVNRRRQIRLKKERMETRRRERAELAETKKLFSQYPPEMMYIPQPSFPVNSTSSMEEFPAIPTSHTNQLQSQSVSTQNFDENQSPPAAISFAQMLKQQGPSNPKMLNESSKTVVNKSLSVDASIKLQKKKSKPDSDEDSADSNDEYYASTRHFQSSFSLEHVFDRMKLAHDEENTVASQQPANNNAPTKKKNKKNKQILFSTGLGGQTKL